MTRSSRVCAECGKPAEARLCAECQLASNERAILEHRAQVREMFAQLPLDPPRKRGRKTKAETVATNKPKSD